MGHGEKEQQASGTEVKKQTGQPVLVDVVQQALDYRPSRVGVTRAIADYWI